MTLQNGTRLGPYEILGQVGAGGMGEVYKARDTRLERTVAVKVLPATLSASEEIRQRFEREAKTISQLSHPHICNLYDVGRHDGTDYLVMEFLEGETLALRLAKGPLPLEQTLRFGIQIADALDRAHRQGIVHRDLKPGNVMLAKGGVKLLDFGLAKEMQSAAGGGDTALPTRVSENLTEKGTVLGTFQYMSPEQLEGKDADARSDIFAFGAVLYEMATGKKAFAGTTQASLISSILRDEPQPISQIAPMTPPALDRVVKTCLAKDPEERWQSAGDVGKELKWIAEGSSAGVAAPQPVAARRRNRERIAWGIAALAIAAAAWLGLSRAHPAAGPALGVMRTTILLPERLSLNNAVISPDGSRLVFGGQDPSGKVQLWIRPLDSYSPTPLAGTQDGVLPFWSPDGRSIGFFANGKMKRIDASGGAPLDLYDVDGVGGAWAPNGDILFNGPSGPIYRLPASGGPAVPVTKLDGARGETAHRYPFLLPDGKHFLFLAVNLAGSRNHPANREWIGSLDGAAPKPLIAASFNALYADGHLLFIRGGDFGGTLLAQPFDPVRLELSGQPATISDQVGLYGDFLGIGDYSVSTNGTLVLDSSLLQRRLAWFDRKGSPAGFVGEAGPEFAFRLSPDGSRVAVGIYDPGNQTTQIWLADVARGVRTRLTTAPGSHSSPVWSPDGSMIAYQSDAKHQADLVVRAADGSGSPEALTDSDGQRIPTDWAKDGSILHIDREAAGSRLEQLSAISVAPPHRSVTVVPRSQKDYGLNPRFSPDGRWVAYDVNESGRSEVYVVSFPDGRGKTQISTDGGVGPKWTRGGREILYNEFGGRVMSVDIDTTNGVKAGTPKPLFDLPDVVSFFGWDVTPDGERFLVNVPVIKSSSVPLDVIVNWPAALKK